MEWGMCKRCVCDKEEKPEKRLFEQGRLEQEYSYRTCLGKSNPKVLC
jgi:hypothetical protein